MSENNERALWSILAYLLSGLAIWGGIGFGVDHWIGKNHYGFITGIILGIGSSMYLAWLRFGRE